jgi:hypothetical protein
MGLGLSQKQSRLAAARALSPKIEGVLPLVYLYFTGMARADAYHSYAEDGRATSSTQRTQRVLRGVEAAHAVNAGAGGR